MNPFQEVRQRVSAQEAARFYGFRLNQAEFICCPFHSGDRTPSLKLYPGTRGWHCFGCGRGGSVIDFAAKLFGLSPLGAVRRLSDDFHLGLPLDRRQTPAERREAVQAAQQRRALEELHGAFESWRADLIRDLNAIFFAGHLALKRCQDLDELTTREALAIRSQAMAEYLADLLAQGSPAEQMAVFRRREEVSAWSAQILNGMPTKSGAA